MRPVAGFTLVELLIIVAILMIMTMGVILTFRPQEQYKYANDSGRRTKVGELGRAFEAYSTSQGRYPPEGPTWMNPLVDNNDIKAIFSTQQPGCNNMAIHQNGYCFDGSAGEAAIFTRLYSQTERDRCGGGKQPWALYSSIQSRAGLACTNGGDPNRGTPIK